MHQQQRSVLFPRLSSTIADEKSDKWTYFAKDVVVMIIMARQKRPYTDYIIPPYAVCQIIESVTLSSHVSDTHGLSLSFNCWILVKENRYKLYSKFTFINTQHTRQMINANWNLVQDLHSYTHLIDCVRRDDVASLRSFLSVHSDEVGNIMNKVRDPRDL